MTVMALSRLGRKAEVDDVSVLHNVFLAFKAYLAVIPADGHGTSAGQGVVGDDFGSNESALDVGVNLAGGVLRRCASCDRPRTTLVLADREKGHVTKKVVARADHAIEPGLREAEV